MIRKYLVIADRISLASSRRDSIKTTAPLFELAIPIDVYWQIEKQMKEFDIMFASGEEDMVLQLLNQKLLKSLAPYVVDEKERALLMARLSSDE